MFVGRGHVDADAGVRVARRLAWRLARRLAWWWMGLARWMGRPRMARWLGTRLGMASRLGMGRTTSHRSARILWRRMCRPASCAWPMGTALDLGEQVLVRTGRKATVWPDGSGISASDAPAQLDGAIVP